MDSKILESINELKMKIDSMHQPQKKERKPRGPVSEERKKQLIEQLNRARAKKEDNKKNLIKPAPKPAPKK